MLYTCVKIAAIVSPLRFGSPCLRIEILERQLVHAVVDGLGLRHTRWTSRSGAAATFAMRTAYSIPDLLDDAKPMDPP